MSEIIFNSVENILNYILFFIAKMSKLQINTTFMDLINKTDLHRCYVFSLKTSKINTTVNYCEFWLFYLVMNVSTEFSLTHVIRFLSFDTPAAFSALLLIIYARQKDVIFVFAVVNVFRVIG